MRAMAARGRIGLSGIYYYYKNKDELLFAIQHHAFSTLVDSLKERLAAIENPKKKLRAIIENHFQFYVDNTEEFRVCVHEIDSLTGKYYKGVLALRQEYFRLVRDVVSQVFHHSQYEIDMATFFLFGSLNWVYMWYDPAKNSDIQRVTTQFLTVFLDGISESKA
jgi:AcrR family transcriptional regulator